MNAPESSGTTRLLRLLGILAVTALSYACDAASTDRPTETSMTAKSAEEGRRTVDLAGETLEKSGIKVEPVERRTFRSHRNFPATVELNRRRVANITTLVRGRATQVYADLGQEVAAGTVLAVLDSRELGDAQAAYLKAMATLSVARRAYDRARILLKEEILSLAEGQRREGDMVRAEAEARESYDRLRLMGMSDAQIEQLAQEKAIRSRVHITAPFYGVVIARNLTEGEVVETTETLFIVADLSHVWVMANVPEQDVAFLPRPGTPRAQSVDVQLPSYPDAPFRGAITYIGNVVDPKTRTLPIRIELPNPQYRLKAEMYAMIRIYSEAEDNVLVVPESAVQSRREERFVFVQRAAHTFEARPVEVGESNGEVVKILKGVQEGDLVVTKSAFTLKSELFGDQV